MRLFLDFANAVYRGAIPAGQIYEAIAVFTAKVLSKSVEVGYGKSIDQIDDTPDGAMLQLLKANLFQFAVAKSASQATVMRDLMIDANGLVKSFEQFAADVLNVHNTYNLTWLRTEYNHAIAASTMAARWVDFQADTETYPNVKYSAVGDDRTTPFCRRLNGVVFAKNDPMLSIITPPNHWNCRSDLLETTAPVRGTNGVNVNDIPPMFRGNVGVTGQMFPTQHPYFESAKNDGVNVQIIAQNLQNK